MSASRSKLLTSGMDTGHFALTVEQTRRARKRPADPAVFQLKPRTIDGQADWSEEIDDGGLSWSESKEGRVGKPLVYPQNPISVL
jgi:hypothetical protein